jgi:ATP-dependent 26S proteasome regulatory subunit
LHEDFTIKEWCIAYDWDVRSLHQETPEVPKSQGKPDQVPSQVLEFDEHTVAVLYDFGMYLDPKQYSYADVVVSALSQIRPVLAASSRWILFVGNNLEIPKTLEHEVVTIDFDLPSDAEISTRLATIYQDYPSSSVDSETDNIVAACRGMTDQQIEDRLLLAMRTYKKLGSDAVKLLLHEKAEIIRQTGLLTYRDPPEGGLDRLGGWENVKEHIVRDCDCLKSEARAYGIPYPKGLLLVGIPGAGKTLMSIAISSYLNLPLIQMDVGMLMSKWVGESESNMRNALKMLERIAPCVLQVDEIEKGFGGVNSEDGGASVRTFGTFLKWLNDRTCPVYVIATANNVESLPAELFRKGRFDEVYGVYLPTLSERSEILSIHLGLLGLGSIFTSSDCLDMAKELVGYTGADIQEVCIMTLKYFWADKFPKHKIKAAKLSETLRKSIKRVLPFAKTNPKTVQTVTSWMNEHTRPAGLLDEGTKLKRRVMMKGDN